MPYLMKKRTIRRESQAGKSALRVARRRARDGSDRIAVAAATKGVQSRMKTGASTTGLWRTMDFIVAFRAWSRQKCAALAPFGPRAPILTNSDHPPLDLRFVANRVATHVFPGVFSGGKKALPAQWWRRGALTVVQNGLVNELKHGFWVILAKTCE